MHSPNAFIALLVVSLPCTIAITPPYGYSYELADNYDVDFTKDGGGGCLKYEDKLKASFDTALEIVLAGKTAMEDLLQPQPPAGSTASGQWSRKAQMYQAMFGRDIGQTGFDGTASEIRADLRELLSANRIPPGDQKSYYLFCGDEWEQYKGPDDKDPTDPNGIRLIRDNPAWKVNGVYYAPSLPAGQQFIDSFSPKAISPCAVEGGAYTLVTDHWIAITFCPSSFNSAKWSTSALTSQIVKGKALDEYAREPLATTWVHEWGHSIQRHMKDGEMRPWQDWPAYNRLCLAEHLGLGKRPRTYGFTLARNLAKCKPEKALSSPENFALFGTAMYFSSWWWGTGYARLQ